MKRVHPSLYALLSFVLLVPGIAFLVLRIRLPDDASYPKVDFQQLIPGGVAVQPLSPSPGGLQAGDVVIEVNGKAVDEYIQGSSSPESVGPTDRIGYVVLRGGRTLALDVPLQSFPLARVIRENWTICVFLVYLELVSLFVFVLRPREAAAQLFLVATSVLFSSSLAWFLGIEVSDLRFRSLLNLYAWGVVFAYGLTLASLVHLTLVFPQRHPVLKRHPRWIVWIYLGVWLPLLVSVALRWAVIISPVGRLVLFVQGTVYMSLVYFPLLLLSTFSSYRAAGTRERRQLRWVMWALVIAVVPYLAFSVVPTLARLPFQIPGYLVGVLWWVVPTSFAIAVLRERLFDIDLIINRTLVYVPLTAILAGLYAASITFFQRIFIASTGQKSDAAVVMSTLILASTFTPIKNSLQVSVDKRFKEPKDPLKELKAFRKQVETVADVINIQRTTRRLLDMAISAAQASGGAVYFERNGELSLLHASAGWKESGEDLTFSMDQDGVQLGLLKLGPPTGKKAYTLEDCRTLQQAVDCVADMVWWTRAATREP